VSLASTYFIDHTHPSIVDFAAKATAGATSQRESAARLFLAVRDGIRYDPYTLHPNAEAYRASAVLAAGRAFCVPKAILLAAAARAQGIPARLGFCDVTNHLSTQRLIDLLGSTVFAFHGFTELFLDGQWRKATPAFNASLCEKFGVPPIDFDGTRDAVLQPYNKDGSRFMEYLKDRGSYDDFPLDEMLRVFREHYPRLMDGWAKTGSLSGDFEGEARSDSAAR
jgi:transglutaminase-like putative cysteine protease